MLPSRSGRNMEQSRRCVPEEVALFLRAPEEHVLHLFIVRPDGEGAEGEALQAAPDHGGAAQDGQTGLVDGVAGGGGDEHAVSGGVLLPCPDVGQKALCPGAHVNVVVGKPDQAGLQVDLIPRQGEDLPRLHLKFPAHPDGKARGGAALLLDDAPKAVFRIVAASLRNVRLGGVLPEGGGKNAAKAAHGHAADTGGIGPTVGFDLADDPVPAEIFQGDVLSLAVQDVLRQTGDVFRRHGLFAPIRDEDTVGQLAIPDVALPEAVRHGGLQGDGAVREQDAAAVQVHLIPGEFVQFLAAQALLPRKAEDDALRAVRVTGEDAEHSRFVRSFQFFCWHGYLLLRRGKSA